MKKDVLIRVKGLQPDIDDTEAIEVISAGTHLQKGDTHYLSYEEADENGKITKNRIKISGKALEMVKKGTVTAQMYFAKGQRQYTCYSTPFGEMTLGVTTKEFHFEERGNALFVRLRYGLEINHAYVSDCELEIEAKER